MTNLVAYHGSQNEKDAILAQLQAHHDADEIVKGKYWEGGKGCAVGCTIHSGAHIVYEPRFGIPQVLAKLEDRLFENLPNGTAKAWPIRFMSAIRPGADLSNIWPQFAVWLLTDANHGVIRHARKQDRETIQLVADTYARGETNKTVWSAIWYKTRKMRAYAADAYAYAADAYAYAAYAAYAADAAAAASAAADAAYARSKHYTAQSKKLLALLAAA